MNKLPLKSRSLILNMLCEGQSMRATARLADVSFNTTLCGLRLTWGIPNGAKL